MANHQVWWLDENYNRFEIVTGCSRLVYHQRLNALQPLEELVLARTSAYASKLRDRSKLLIYRSGALVWGGELYGDAWETDGSITFKGRDYTDWAARTTILPVCSIGTEPEEGPKHRDGHEIADYTVRIPHFEYWQPTDWHVDDICRQLVRHQLIAPIEAGRAWPGLECEDDFHAGPVRDLQFRGGTVLQELQKLAQGYGLWWRFVPTETGARFMVRYPEWGRDLTAGNNPQCVFSEDWGTAAKITVERDYSGVRNVIYANRQGGTLPPLLVHRDEDSIAAFRRSEQWLECPSAGTYAALNDLAKAGVEKAKIREVVTVEPAVGRCDWISKWLLGDKVTVESNRGSRPFSWGKHIIGVHVEASEDGTEIGTPELEV